MQEILTKFLDTVEQTPALLQLDGALRYVFPLLALVILIRCGKSLLMFRREPEVWAWLAGRRETVFRSCTGRASSAAARAAT